MKGVFIVILSALFALILVSCADVHDDYIVTDKYFSPRQYTKIRYPEIKGGYTDKDTYIPDTYILIFSSNSRRQYDKYKDIPKSFYDKVNIGDTICFIWGEFHPCSSYQLKKIKENNKQSRK
jgi:hypothetical protein